MFCMAWQDQGLSVLGTIIFSRQSGRVKHPQISNPDPTEQSSGSICTAAQQALFSGSVPLISGSDRDGCVKLLQCSLYNKNIQPFLFFFILLTMYWEFISFDNYCELNAAIGIFYSNTGVISASFCLTFKTSIIRFGKSLSFFNLLKKMAFCCTS